MLQKNKSDTLNRIHKVLTQINIKVQHIISDIEGVIGMQIIERFAAGITDPQAMLEGLAIEKFKASREQLELASYCVLSSPASKERNNMSGPGNS